MKPIRYTMMINKPAQLGVPLTIDGVIESARRGEREGFDVLSYADWAVGDPFPPLMLIAQATERAQLLTRVIAANTRSPILLAAGAAWVDAASGGRFMLGLGASVPDVVEGRHGLKYEKPASRLEDTVRVVRALWGEEVAGVERNPDGSVRYQGTVIKTQKAFVDTRPAGPTPHRRLSRPPIILAASGPRMMKIAGALADGVILELTTAQYVRWAIDLIRQGAAEAGRTLDDFEICVQASLRIDRGDQDAKSREFSMNFMINHCVYPEFKHLWRAAGLETEAQAVRDAVARGDRATAERVIVEGIYPKMVVYGQQADTEQALYRWMDERIDAGVTMFGFPVDIADIIGVDLATIRRHADARLAAVASDQTPISRRS